MNKSFIFACAFAIIVSFPTGVYADRSYVIHVIDGDTFIAKIGKKIEHIRIIGIDTPELHDPKTGVAQCYSREASSELRKLMYHKNVDVQKDTLTKNRDIYGRYLRIVNIGTLSISEHLVKNGFARVYTRSPASQLSVLLKRQDEAKKAHRGLWSSCSK